MHKIEHGFTFDCCESRLEDSTCCFCCFSCDHIQLLLFYYIGCHIIISANVPLDLIELLCVYFFGIVLTRNDEVYVFH